MYDCSYWIYLCRDRGIFHVKIEKSKGKGGGRGLIENVNILKDLFVSKFSPSHLSVVAAAVRRGWETSRVGTA